MTLPDRICFITRSGSFFEIVRTILEEGIRWVQYREKVLTRREIYHEALRLRELTRGFSACLIVNDHTDIALAVEADGVHLGQEDLPLREARRIMGRRIIGISTHSPAEAREAERAGADYIGFGPLFPTATKDAGAPKGPAAVREIKSLVRIPVVAIGGIKPGNAGEVFAAGCDAIAVSSGLSEGDPRTQARLFLETVRGRGTA